MQAALIGLGMVADMHVAAIAATGGQVGLRGVFARRAQATAAFAERHGVRPYATLAEVAVDPEVDFVILATPPDARLEAVKLLADAGKPILMEKPIERDLPTARALVEMCEAQNVPLGVVF
ncbi:MAG: Gfo/Idh/MocA family protein, partial [Sedimentitalea sp.]